MQINTKAHPDVTPQQMLVPEQNIDYGTGYLREQTNRFGPDLSAVISSYNAGHPISGNSPYVASVLQYYDWFKQNDLNIVEPSNGGTTDGGGTSTGSGFPQNKDIWLIVGGIIGILILASVLSR
jgi:soluble lytic murein transglycosylase-like protein